MNNVIDINIAREMTEKGLDTVNSLSEDGILDYLVESINKDILEFSKCGDDSFTKDFTQYIPEKFIPYVKRNLVKELKTLYKNAGYICSIKNEESIIRGTSLFQITIDWSKRKSNYYNKPIDIYIAKINASNTRLKFEYDVDEFNVIQFLIDLINNHIIYSSKAGYPDMEFPVDKFIPEELLSNIDEYKNKLIEIYNSYGYKCNILENSNTITIDWDRI